MKNIIFLLAFLGLVQGQLQAISLYYKPVESGEAEKFGIIKYNSLDASAEFVQDHVVAFQGLASIGFEDSAGKVHYSTFGQLDRTRQKNFILHVVDDHVAKVDYNLGETTTGGNGPDVVVVESALVNGPQPAVKAPIKLVNNKVPEPEVEKSFLQKYWFYIVPIILMLLVSNSAEN